MYTRTLPVMDENDLAGSAEHQAALVQGMIAGSARSWREFHARYDRLVYRCITKVTARFAMLMNQDDIREIYATLLVQLLANDMHKLRTFEPGRGNRLGSWIGLLAINCAYDYLRTLRKEAGRASIDDIEDEVWSDSPSPHELLELKRRLELVASILRDLSEKDREFVSLYFDEGLDAEQIADRMQISVKTVYSKKHKIQCRIEARLADARLAA
jgi:RNA polymerase sigma-70 factor, ECF subfamily